jgi:hypothetical protein
MDFYLSLICSPLSPNGLALRAKPQLSGRCVRCERHTQRPLARFLDRRNHGRLVVGVFSDGSLGNKSDSRNSVHEMNGGRQDRLTPLRSCRKTPNIVLWRTSYVTIDEMFRRLLAGLLGDREMQRNDLPLVFDALHDDRITTQNLIGYLAL